MIVLDITLRTVGEETGDTAAMDGSKNIKTLGFANMQSILSLHMRIIENLHFTHAKNADGRSFINY